MGAAPYCKISIDCDQFFEDNGQDKHVNISFQNEANNVKSANHDINNITPYKEKIDFYGKDSLN